MVKFYFISTTLILCLTECFASTKVSIYYESLCPDSVDFIINQLYPNYENLRDRITVDFVPYGKATQEKRDGTWKFRCQHGNNECNGNKYQGCILNQKKGQDDDVKVINCIMSLPDPSDPIHIETCTKNNSYDWKSIKNCYDDGKGDNLLAAYGDKTHNLNPTLRFIPTIIFNDRFDQKLQDGALYDFLKTVCDIIPNPKPDVC